MTRRLLTALAACALALSACGEKQEPTASARPDRARLTVMLDAAPSANHAGIYAAAATGAFERVGLEVAVRAPDDRTTPLELLSDGRADLAIASEPELFLARDKGAELVGIGAIGQKPLTSIIALGSARIRTPADLAGKTVGTAGTPLDAAYLRTILTRVGVDEGRLRQIEVGRDPVRALVSERVDATLTGFWNTTGVQLEQERRAPSIVRVDRAGVPTYDELVLVARQDDLGERGRLFRRFVQALRQGAEAVRADPATGVDALLEADPGLDRDLQVAAVEDTSPLLFPEDAKRPFGWQDPEQWRAYGRWMQDNRLLTTPPSQALLTNEFLPGEGVRPVEADPGEQGGE